MPPPPLSPEGSQITGAASETCSWVSLGTATRRCQLVAALGGCVSLRGVSAEVLLYVDPQSPYSWLAHARAPGVFGVAPQLRPIVLGPIFARRGWGSWGRTEEREAGQREVERRAAAYGLGAVRWPDGWPLDSLRPRR